MSKWDFGRLTAFLEAIEGGAESARDWLQTQTDEDMDRSELFRRFDALAHDWDSLKRLVKVLRSTRR